MQLYLPDNVRLRGRWTYFSVKTRMSLGKGKRFDKKQGTKLSVETRFRLIDIVILSLFTYIDYYLKRRLNKDLINKFLVFTFLVVQCKL